MTRGRNNVSSAIAAVLLAVGAIMALAACESTEPEAEPIDRAELEKLIDASPPTLAELYRRDSELTDAGREGFERALADLEGHPVVVNVWASWCGPCRAEFPHFREVALERGSDVAFLGLDSDDNDDAARTFLRDHPIPYPSYTDPDKRIAIDLGATFGFPATVYFDRTGEQVHVHHGGYASSEDLIADVERYALADG